MEKKTEKTVTTKKTTKPAAKTTKPAVKTTKSVAKVATTCECKCADNTKILNKIFYALIALTVISALTFVTIFINLADLPSTGNNTATEEALGEYDVSMFDQLTTTEALSKISDGSKYVVYIGRPTCGYCVKFLPNLQQAQKDYGYKTIYIDLEQMTAEDQESIKSVDNEENYISENFGYTPMVLVFENGKLKQGWVGYAEYDKFASFLEDNGFSK